MPSNFVSSEEYFDEFYRSRRRRSPETMVYTTNDAWEFMEARASLMDGRATTLGGTYGFVTEIKPPTQIDREIKTWTIYIQPTYKERQNTTASQQVEQMLHDHWTAIKEDSMKVYEGIIVKLDEQGQPAEVLKVVTPFVAKDANQAVDEIRVEYARENKLTGKDAAALRVRVREFPVS